MSQPPHGGAPPPYGAPQSHGPGAPYPGAPTPGAPYQGQGAHPPAPPPGIDVFVPTNPLAAVSCWVGILSLLLCGFGLILGPIALVTGVMSLKRGALVQQSSYGKATSTARSWIGIVTGGLGTLGSVVFLVRMVLERP